MLPDYTVTSVELLMSWYGATAVRILARLNRDLKMLISSYAIITIILKAHRRLLRGNRSIRKDGEVWWKHAKTDVTKTWKMLQVSNARL